MDKKALQLCSIFALQPNELGYCGKKSATASFKKCITKGDCDSVIPELEQFIVLNPYLETISQATGRDKFSFEVVEAYWMGGELLNKIQPKHYQLLLENLKKQGVPEKLINSVKNKKPDPFIPIHLFNILHIGVGKASESVPFNLNSINSCMIRWGNILEIKKNSCQIKLTGLDKDWKLSEEIEDIKIDPSLTPNLKKDDTVAIHWGYVAKKLSDRELTNLIIYTQRLLTSLKAINS